MIHLIVISFLGLKSYLTQIHLCDQFIQKNEYQSCKEVFPVIQLIQARHYKTFSENIVFIFNASSSSLQQEHLIQFIHLVLLSEVDEFFYRNDAQVVFDIIQRNIENTNDFQVIIDILIFYL